METGRGSKKAVRFSSPFDVDLVEMQRKAGLKPMEPSNRNDSMTSVRGREKDSPDSWDAFDAKMFKKIPVKKDASQFLQLNSANDQSQKIADDDFSALSFQDAKDLIDRDENERLQFMNSKVSFSDGIDQVEAPSLLSVTNYFQQGSSFPVPYVGNDSTMFGEMPSFAVPTPPTPVDTSRKSLGVSRNDSLAKFFLGSESNGLNKTDIVDYVLDYCKRRASLQLSDVSDVGNSFNNSPYNSIPERHDSGIGVGREDKRNSNDLKSRSEKKEKRVTAEKPSSNLEKRQKSPYLPNQNDAPTIESKKSGKEVKTATDSNKNAAMEKFQKNIGTRHSEQNQVTSKALDKDNEDSVLLASGTTIRETDALDYSDVGSIDGFEKFKKNLNLHQKKPLDDRYRGRTKHHTDFQRKRLNVDERYSHPQLSPLAFKGPGASVTMERPSKKFNCRSPPEKLVETPEPGVMQQKALRPKKPKPLEMPGSEEPSSSFLNNKVQISKPSNVVLTSDVMSVVPAVHSAIQHAVGTPTCSCPHQCGQQPGSQGLIHTPGFPIVINIHLPLAPPVSGTVTHTTPILD